MMKKNIYTLLLIGLYPLIGLWILHSKPSSIVAYYLVESIIIGLFNIGKIFLALPNKTDKNSPFIQSLKYSAFLILFYFIFLFVFGFGVFYANLYFEQFGSFNSSTNLQPIFAWSSYLISGVYLLILYIHNYFFEFLPQKGYLLRTKSDQFSEPISRVFILFFTCGIGLGLFHLKFGNYIGPTILILVCTLLDLFFYHNPHLRPKTLRDGPMPEQEA